MIGETALRALHDAFEYHGHETDDKGGMVAVSQQARDAESGLREVNAMRDALRAIEKHLDRIIGDGYGAIPPRGLPQDIDGARVEAQAARALIDRLRGPR